MTIIQRNTAAALLLALLHSANGFSTTRSVSLGRPSTILASSAVEEAEQTQAKSWDDDGFVFGLDGSGLERPKGKTAQIVLEGDSLETTDTQRAIVWSTFAGHALLFSYCVNQMIEANQGLFGTFSPQVAGFEAIMLSLTSWVLADFGSGVLHWSVDNYGNGKTPVMGGIIAAFQGHHSAPWTICERGFENNVYKLCVPFGVQTVLALKFIFGLGPAATLFLSVFSVTEILSQEFHKMSHATKKEAGPVWNALQDLGITIDRQSHAQHHIAPYDGNYCIVNGLCNKSLDESGFFRRLEHIVYNLNGVESNAWKLDAELRERTLNGDYSMPQPTAP